MCFLCESDSRAENHWEKLNWPCRSSISERYNNLINDPLIGTSELILPPFHIELSLMKHFIKTLHKDSHCFKLICNTFRYFNDMSFVFKVLECRMSVKVQFLASHLLCFPEKYLAMSRGTRGKIPSGSEDHREALPRVLEYFHVG
jgi:hypothetical protein